ncbi:MAG: ATP-binding protein [Saprospiraceae bacterium]
MGINKNDRTHHINIRTTLLWLMLITSFVVSAQTGVPSEQPLFTADFRAWVNLLYAGGIFLIASYHLLSYFAIRDKSYFFYSIYLICSTLFIIYIWLRIDTLLLNYFFPEHPEWSFYLAQLLIPAFASYLVFIRYFINAKEVFPRWDKILNVVVWLAVPAVIINLSLYLWQSNIRWVSMINVTYTLLISLTILFMLIPLFRTQQKRVQFFIGGLSCLILGLIGATISFVWEGREGHFLYCYQTGAVLEVLFFSLGLAYKTRHNEKEKQQAELALFQAELHTKQQQVERKRLEVLDRAKTNFFTNITHEFRTPLTVIMGMNEQINGHENEKQLIQRNSQNLLRLINQLLDLAKFDAGNLQPNYIQSDVVHFVRYLTESFYSLARERDIRLTFYSELDTYLMDYDSEKLQQIIYNLLSNALKFTAPRGKVILHLKLENIENRSFLQLKIKDTGIGIAKTELPRIYDRFYQINAPQRSDNVGSGIGLALTKDLVQLLNGTIEVKSELAKGTTFTINLPVSNLAKKQMQKEVRKKQKPRIKNVKDSTRISHQTFSPHISLHQPILLIIEDNADVTAYITSILKDKYQIQTAANGKIGIDKAIQLIPDIIISDVMMPEADGYEVCATLKKDRRTSHIPIILLTAKATQQAKTKGLKYGADAYLVKPFHQEELLVRLEQLISLRQKMQWYFQEKKSKTKTKKKLQIENISAEDDFIELLKTAVATEMDNPEFGVTQLTAISGMSRTQTYRKLKALTGNTPTQFVRMIRLQAALDLLKSEQMNISEVAYAVGFKDPNYFTRVFQQEFGYSPSEVNLSKK